MTVQDAQRSISSEKEWSLTQQGPLLGQGTQARRKGLCISCERFFRLWVCSDSMSGLLELSQAEDRERIWLRAGAWRSSVGERVAAFRVALGTRGRDGLNRKGLFFSFISTSVSTSRADISERSKISNILPWWWTQISKKDVWMKRTEILSWLVERNQEVS